MRLYVIFCLLLCVCFVVDAQTPPKQLKENTIGTLESINTSSLPKKIRHKIKKKIKRAISFIKESLKFKGQELFLDELRIVPPPQGKRVFYCEYVAAGILSHKLPKTTPQSIKNTFNQVIADLVLADKLIASHSINNAQMLVDVGEGNAKKLAKAKKKFNLAVNTTNNPQKAIRRFKDAWALAQKVIKDRKIVILSFNDSPDPFAPHTQANTLTLTYRIHKFGLYLPRAKRVELETTEVIKNASGVVVRKIVKREQINLPPRRPRNKTFNVTTTLVWDGKDNAGNIVADGQYTYLAFGKLIKVIRRHRREKERVKATSFPVSGTIDVQGSGGDTTPPIISNLQPATGSFIANLKPTISATFSDDSSRINTSSVQILLDTTNITSSANVTSSGFSFTPANDLTETNHIVSVTVQDNAGNQTQASTSFTLDVTPPTITASVSPGANGNGWHRENATVSFSATDSGSGVASVTPDVVVSTEGANQVINGTATDNAGNSANTSVTVNLDKTPPVLASSATPEANSNGWNNTNVDIAFTATDALSGVDQVTGNTTLTGEGANQQTIGTATDLAGNTATLTTSINIDKTPPTLTSSQTPNANANGWNNTDVAINFAATDTLSGIDQINGNTTLTSEGVSQQVNGSAIDLAGNIANLTAAVSIDKTAPTITPTASPQPNANGWNNSDTTVSFTVSDLLSGVDQSSSNTIVSTEGANQVVNGTVTDLAGNNNSASITINLDKTAPTITSSLSSPANNNGWHKEDVTVSFTSSDSLSGIDQTTPNTSVNTEGANQIINGSATDLAGNSASTSVTVNLDKTAPTITANATPGPNTFGWNNTDVVISFAANDTLSGIDQSTADTTLTSEGANQTVSGNATDKAGNTASTSISINIDKTAPTISASASPAPNANGWNNSDVTVSFTSSDNLSGIDQSPANVIVNTDGANQVISGNAVDKAGNSASASSTVNLDKTAPVVTLNPASGAFVNTKTPLLVANFADPTSGANFSTLQITFNSNNITSQAQVIQQGASFQTTSDLADGNHSWQVNLSDLAGNTTNVNSAFQVSTDEAQTKLIGKVADTNNNPLANVPVSLDANQTTTNANGEFELSTTPGERVLKVDGSAQGFATIAEPIEIKAGVNTLPREIFLPAVDLNTFGVQVSQTQDITLANPTFPGVEVKVFAGSVFNPDGTPYTGKLMVLQVPRDRTPLSLPEDIQPDIVAAVQPGGLSFNPPALLTMPNTPNYPESSNLEIHSMNPNTGKFEHVGTSQIQGNQAVTTQGGMNFSAWHLVIPPTVADIKQQKDQSVSDSSDGCKHCVSSTANSTTGNLEEDYTLPSVRFLGKNFAPRLVYQSRNAFPRVNLQNDLDYSSTIKPVQTEDNIEFAGISVKGAKRDFAGTTGSEFRMAHQIDVSQIPTQILNVEYGSRAKYTIVGGIVSRNSRSSTKVMVNNQSKSPFGAGWTLDLPVPGSFSRLYPQSDVLLTEGDGSTKLFKLGTSSNSILCIGNQLWTIANTGGLAIRVYNATTLQLVKEFPIDLIGGSPFTVISSFTHDPANEKLYALAWDRSITRIRMIEIDMVALTKREGPIVPGITPINTGNPRNNFVVSVFDEIVFLAFGGKMVRFSTATLDLVSTVSFSDNLLGPLKASQDGQKGWFITFAANFKLVEMDLSTFTVDRELIVPSRSNYEIAHNYDRNEIYLTASGGGLDTDIKVVDIDTFTIKKSIPMPSNLRVIVPGFGEVGNPAVSPGIGSHIYVNLIDVNQPQAGGTTVLSLVDTETGTILNSSLGTNLRYIDSVPGDTRLFAIKVIFNATPTDLQVIDGETGLVLQSTPISSDAGIIKPKPRGTLTFVSPPGDFSLLSLENNNTPNDLTDDFYIRRMKDGTEHKYSLGGLLQHIKDRNGNTFTFSYTDADNDGKAEELASFTTPVNTQYTFAYANGKLTSITDPAGRVNSFTIDANGDLIRIDKPDNTNRQFVYNEKHLLTSQTKERGFISRYEYDIFGHIKKSILPDDCVYLYKAELGASLVDPSSTTIPTAQAGGDVAGLFTDARGNPSSTKTNDLLEITDWTDELGQQTTTQRDANSLPTNINDRRGVNFVQTWDNMGNLLTSSQNDLGITNSYEYESKFNLIVEHTNPRGAITTYTRDENGNLTKLTDHLGNETSFVFNSQGLVISMTDELGRTTTYTRDSNGNVITITDANNNPTTITRDAAGNILTITDELLRVTTFTYDPLNRLLTRKNALNDIATWVYDNYGNVTSFSDENNHTTAMVYDQRERLISRTNPIGDTETITLDENSNVTKRIDFKGKITLFQYDKLNRLVKQIRKMNDTAETEDADDIVSTVGYDPESNILSTTDALGRKIYRKYDQINRVTQINRKVGDTLDEINADDSVTKITYDLASNIVSTIDPNNKFVYRDYDLLNRRTKIIQKIGDTANTEDVDDIVTNFEFDGVHNNIKITDGNGKVIYRKFDNLDRLTKVIRKVTDTADIIDADDAVTAISYDDVDNLLSITKPNNIVVSQTFDKLNRVETRTNGAGETDSLEYDPVGNILKLTRANGNIINIAYDVLDRLISATDAHGAIVTRTYDPVSNVLTSTDGNGNTLTHKYDDIHRRIETIDALGKSSFATYDKVNNIVQIKDRNNNITIRTFDDLNRLLTSKDALNFITAYTYNESSDLLSITDALNQTTTYAYDDIHRRIKTTYVDGTEVILSYDKVHNVLSRLDQNGATTNYFYSDLYFLIQRSYPVDAADIFTHDKDGRILTATKGDWTCVINYDGADRLIQEISNGKTLAKTYNIPARTFTCQFPQGRTLTKTRDKRDRLISIKDTDNSTIASYNFDPGNRMVSCTTENGITRTNTWDKNNNIIGIEHKKVSTNTPIAHFTYTRDDEENILTIKDELFPNFSQKLSLDKVYRIINFKQGQLSAGDIATPNREISYQLDGVSNWESKTTNGVVENRTHNNLNEIASINGAAFVHDNNGNLKDDGQKLYKYDTENRLIEVARKSDGRVLVQYQYDAFGRRVRKKIFDPNTGILSKQVEFYCDQESVIEEYEKNADAGGNLGAERLVRQFVDGDNIDEHVLQDIYDGAGNISQSLYYVTNHRMDSSVITDNTGSVLFRLKYDVYGKIFKLNAQNQLENFQEEELVIWGLQGRRLEEETGLYFFRARYYSATQGRFLQRDPMGYMDSMSLYEPFGSNAHKYSDPYGENWTKKDKQAFVKSLKKYMLPYKYVEKVIYKLNIKKHRGENRSDASYDLKKTITVPANIIKYGPTIDEYMKKRQVSELGTFMHELWHAYLKLIVKKNKKGNMEWENVVKACPTLYYSSDNQILNKGKVPANRRDEHVDEAVGRKIQEMIRVLTNAMVSWHVGYNYISGELTDAEMNQWKNTYKPKFRGYESEATGTDEWHDEFRSQELFYYLKKHILGEGGKFGEFGNDLFEILENQINEETTDGWVKD